MDFRRILLGLLIGVAFVLLVRWAPLLTPFVVGIVVGAIVGKPVRAAIVGLAVGVVGNAISSVISLFATSWSVGITSETLIDIFPHSAVSNVLLFGIFTTLAIVVGSVIGGYLAWSRRKKNFQRGMARGEDVERMRELEEEKERAARRRRRK